MPKNLRRVAEFVAAAASGSIIGALAVIFFLGFENTTTWSPVEHHGPENSWLKLAFNDKINFNGDWAVMHFTVGPANTCDKTAESDISDGRSVHLYDEFNSSRDPQVPLPEGMKIYLYWHSKCKDQVQPYSVITVPANTTYIKVPKVNLPSDNYEVFNNFQQSDGGVRKLNGHIYAIRWKNPE